MAAVEEVLVIVTVIVVVVVVVGVVVLVSAKENYSHKDPIGTNNIPNGPPSSSRACNPMRV
jgi:threonine/homoserine efflux transporter RhtA